MKRRTFLAVAISATCFGIVDAAELKSDYQKEQQQRGERTVRPPRPPIRRMNPIADMVGRCQVLNGHHYRGLTVFPVQLRGYELGISPLTLDEALRQNAIVITEKGTGQVPVLRVQNRSGQYVFVMSGEILVGGKQNRILREDILLPPHCAPIELPAYCVEQGRWVKKAETFKTDGNLASSKIRLRAQKAAGQNEIWSGIAETAKELKQKSATGDFNTVYNQRDVAKKLGEYREEFCRILPRQIVGIVVARNGQFVAADLFGNASLFYKLRGKVLDSYAIDVLGCVRRIPAPPDRNAAEQFLRRVLSAGYHTQGTPGAGTIGRAVGNGIDAKGLIFSNRVTHVSLFPAATILPMLR
ncbi:MAG: hypothetical protein GXP25_16705 [Planctomycetes bacterium]|nr:hypothetical protein [Planctomycetota bacterium]